MSNWLPFELDKLFRYASCGYMNWITISAIMGKSVYDCKQKYYQYSEYERKIFLISGKFPGKENEKSSDTARRIRSKKIVRTLLNKFHNPDADLKLRLSCYKPYIEDGEFESFKNRNVIKDLFPDCLSD